MHAAFLKTVPLSRHLAVAPWPFTLGTGNGVNPQQE